MLDALMGRDWVVFSKPCLSRTETVVDYLGRYSHRIALSDGRLRVFDGRSVTLTYKDYRDGDRRKQMVLDAKELVRRFLLHVLPKGFMRVHHFGFLTNRCRAKRLAQIRAALSAPEPNAPARCQTEPQPRLCPGCGTARLRRVSEALPRSPRSAPQRPPRPESKRLEGG